MSVPRPPPRSRVSRPRPPPFFFAHSLRVLGVLCTGLAAAKLTQPPNLATSSDGSTAATSDGEGDVTRTRPWRRLIRRRQRERGTTGGRRRAQDGRHRRAELIERDVPHAYTDVLRGLLSPAHGSAVRAAAAATPLAETGGPVFTATADVPLVSAGNSGFEGAFTNRSACGDLLRKNKNFIIVLTIVVKGTV